ncbi:MAG: ribonuclease R [Mariprofundales bacterium]|nr:ribonuclease R [Mariprofundales bacterium]
MKNSALSQLFRKQGRRGMSWHQIKKSLGVEGAAEEKILQRQLDAMIARGEISKRDRCYVAGRAQSWTGTLCAHPDGFGFVRIAEREKDLFLPREEMVGLMDGDCVEVTASMRRGRETGHLVRVVEAASTKMVGQFQIVGGVGIVTPRSKRMQHTVLIRDGDTMGAHDGDWVRIEVDRATSPLRGRVVSCLGELSTPAELIDMVIDEAAISTTISPQVEQEAAAIPGRPSRKDVICRHDLRHLPMVTIDGADAKDFDDAICVLPRGDGFEAWVAIADVAHYVEAGSAIDKCAAERGNSFYFPDRAIPMLPESLANGLCSLRPRVNRLVVALRMRINGNGTLRSVRAFEAVIRSRARLTYEQVAALLDGSGSAGLKQREICDMLQAAYRLFKLLQQQRQRRGAIDFDSTEMQFSLDGDGVHSIVRHQQSSSMQVIEELMLLANTSVARMLEEAGYTPVYRVHPAPKPQDIDALNQFLDAFALRIKQPKGGDVLPADIQRVMVEAQERGVAHILSRLVLRAMQQASYQPEQAPHFGLAYQHYCHFTSPIRRYSDLLVHRQLKALLRKERQPSLPDLVDICTHLSAQERVQQRAEWDCQAMLAALFHQRDIGRVCAAHISGMSKRRIFVELDATGAEGSLAVDQLAGEYLLDECNHLLRNRHTGDKMTLGDAIDVTIEGCDPVRGQIRVAIAGVQ